jgi:hypothetical protein
MTISKWTFSVPSKAYYATLLKLEIAEKNIIEVHLSSYSDGKYDGCVFEFGIEYYENIGWQYHIFDECFEYKNDLNYFFGLFKYNNMKLNFKEMIELLEYNKFEDTTPYTYRNDD